MSLYHQFKTTVTFFIQIHVLSLGRLYKARGKKILLSIILIKSSKHLK